MRCIDLTWSANSGREQMQQHRDYSITSSARARMPAGNSIPIAFAVLRFLEGEHRIYTRDCPEGRKLHNHFCPTCGSTVGWTLDLRPNQFGVAVGCFNDRNFPPPVASIWEEEMCAWTMLPSGIQHFPRARPVPSAS